MTVVANRSLAEPRFMLLHTYFIAFHELILQLLTCHTIDSKTIKIISCLQSILKSDFFSLVTLMIAMLAEGISILLYLYTIFDHMIPTDMH